MCWYIAQGIGFGLAAAVQPGPLQTYLISQALLRGWRRSLLSACAPLISDGPIIALCVFLLSQLQGWLQRFLYIAGGCFVLYLAYDAYKSWKRFDTHLPAPETAASQSLFQAALMNLLAPGAYLFWIFVSGPILIRGWRETPWHAGVFLIGFYLAMIGSLCLLILIFSAARQLGPRVNRALLGASAVVLLCFGCYELWLGIKG